MIPRKYSLKTKSDFRYLFQKGEEAQFSSFFVKFKYGPKGPFFGIVVSSKISKKAVTRNKVKRLLSQPIGDFIRANKALQTGKFVIIPKRHIIDESGKINVDAKVLIAEVDTFLSKMVVA